MGLVLTAETAADYFTLCEVDAEIRILDDTVASMEKATALVQNRHDGGVASGLWPSSKRYWRRPTQAKLEWQLRTNDEHALAVLCGSPASDFRVADGSGNPARGRQSRLRVRLRPRLAAHKSRQFVNS